LFSFEFPSFKSAAPKKESILNSKNTDAIIKSKRSDDVNRKRDQINQKNVNQTQLSKTNQPFK
jgi:hypothetical protein